MTRRYAAILAGALTAFVLVVVGAVGAYVAQPAAAAASGPSDPAAQTPQDREAAYQQLIAEANARPQQPYAALAGTATPAPAAPQSAQFPVSPDQAAALALQAAPGAALIGTPELVSLEGTPAYEVRLDRGLIYIDATSGQVLYNGTFAAPSPFFRGEREHEGWPELGGDD